MPPTAQSVTFPGASAAQLAGYIARPEGDRASPAVVIIHELFGLNDNMRDIAHRFAEQGYAALAVDLFAGRNRAVCMMRFMGGMLFNSLDHGAIRDLKAALSWLAGQPNIDAARLGAIGFCMGGSFAIAWACDDDRLKAIAPYYAMNPRPLAAVSRACPLVGSYPEQDFTAKAAGALDAELHKHAIPHDIKVYPGARHSFFNNQGGGYDPAASNDSWRRVLAFFEEHIR